MPDGFDNDWFLRWCDSVDKRLESIDGKVDHLFVKTAGIAGSVSVLITVLVSQLLV